MVCPICGCTLPQGAQRCPACGTPLLNPGGAGGFTPGYGLPVFGGGNTQGYPPNVYQPGSGPNTGSASAPGGNARGGNGFPPSYRQARSRYSAQGTPGGAFLGAISNLPRVLRGIISDPGETLRGMMEREDRYTGAVVAGLSLLITFLAAVLVARGLVASVFSGLSGFGVSLAGSEVSLNQSVNYVAGKISTSVGGIAVLCQLLAILLPAAAELTYLCAVRRARFSFLLASNLVAIITLPSVAAGLICMPLGLLSPVLAGLALVLGEVVSYVLLCSLLEWAAGLPRTSAVPVKAFVVCASAALKILLIWLVGGALAGGVLQTAGKLIAAMGSLL